MLRVFIMCTCVLCVLCWDTTQKLAGTRVGARFPQELAGTHLVATKHEKCIDNSIQNIRLAKPHMHSLVGAVVVGILVY